LCKLDKHYPTPIKRKARNISNVDWSKLSKTDLKWLRHPVVLRMERFVADIVKKSEFSDVLSIRTDTGFHNLKPESHYDEKHVDTWIFIRILIPKCSAPFDHGVEITTDKLRKCASPEDFKDNDWAAIEKRANKILGCYRKKGRHKNNVAYCRGIAKLLDEIRKRIPPSQLYINIVDLCTFIETGFKKCSNDPYHPRLDFHKESNTVSWVYRDSNGSREWKRKPIDEATAEAIAEEIINDPI